jgi:hypothetical protein
MCLRWVVHPKVVECRKVEARSPGWMWWWGRKSWCEGWCASVHVSASALSSARTQDRASSLSWIEALPTERGARRPEHSLLSSGDWHHLRSSYARISYASPMQSFGPSRRSSSHWYSSFSSCLSLFSSLFLLDLSFGRPRRFHGRSLSSCSMGASCRPFVLIACTQPA